jgi:hypothetical protein
MAGNKHQLFLIHGMGKQGAGWSIGMESAIRTAFKSIPMLSNFNFDDVFDFVPITYDQHFDDLRRQWAKQAASLMKFLNPLAKAGELDATGKVITKLARAADSFQKDDFIRTHLLDVFLYRFASNSRHSIRANVADQILKRLAGLDTTSAMRWSVIAHSLGTSVAHDVLHEMFSATAQKQKLALGQLTFPNALVMLANVSRVLESDIDVYSSIVAPGAPAAPRFAVRHYINAFHEFDPIPAAAPFEPVSTWPAPAVRDDGLFGNIRIADIEDLDVHSAEHHIRNPRVHAPMFNAIFDSRIFGQDEIDRMHAKYRATLPLSKVNELIDELKAFNPRVGDSPARIIKGWRDFLDAIEKLKK